MNAPITIARALSAAFVAGDLDVDRLVDRGSHVLGRSWRWLRPLAKRVVAEFSGRTPPRCITVTRFVLADRGFLRACDEHKLQVTVLLGPAPQMRPFGVAKSWKVRPIRSAGELAEWLGITTCELDWFADLRGFESKRNQGRLRHYHYRPLMKRPGQFRLIESPKPRLKEIQRRILNEILDLVVPHTAAHGFRRGFSIKSFAAPHVGQRVVLKIDLQDFFPSIAMGRIQAFFRAIGYPEHVADLLAGLCTNFAPTDAWPEELVISDGCLPVLQRQYSKPHLPQGAPTSPALANLCAYRLDCRLAGLAQAAGAVYTRYADDLAFSGDREFDRVANRFQLHVCATVMEEHFRVHHRKTRIMRQGVRQRLVGMVVNRRLNIPRKDFDRLKATLTNCIRHGARSQNRGDHHDYRRHLEGRISFVESIHPSRGEKLRKLYDQIQW